MYKSLTRTLPESISDRDRFLYTFNRKMEIIQKCNKIYLHCFYGTVLWELNNNNNDIDHNDVKKVVTFNRKMEII